jgi:hypothetical protein
MDSILEGNRFNLPTGGAVSEYSGSPLKEIGECSKDYSKLVSKAKAVEFGFPPTGPLLELKGRKGNWIVLSRPNHITPEFPEGETEHSYSLGIYEREEKMSAAVLRVTDDPLDPETFAQDLENITKFYAERPKIFGYPSKLSSASTAVFTHMFGAMGLTGLVTHMLGAPLEGVMASLIPSQIVGATLGVQNMLFSEKFAKKGVGNLDQLYTGFNVEHLLDCEHSHALRVSVQRELYRLLQEDGREVSPEDFLQNVYPQIPSLLLTERRKELELQKKAQDHGVVPEETETLENIVSVAKMLLPLSPNVA